MLEEFLNYYEEIRKGKGYTLLIDKRNKVKTLTIRNKYGRKLMHVEALSSEVLYEKALYGLESLVILKEI